MSLGCQNHDMQKTAWTLVFADLKILKLLFDLPKNKPFSKYNDKSMLFDKRNPRFSSEWSVSCDHKLLHTKQPHAYYITHIRTASPSEMNLSQLKLNMLLITSSCGCLSKWDVI